MPKILITGVSGTGKTTTINELSKRGYTAYDADSIDGLCRLEYRDTGEVASWPRGYIDWSKYSYNVNISKLESLLNSNETVFFGVVAGNQKAFYAHFDTIIALEIPDGDKLMHRLKTRNVHEHGQELPNLLRTVNRAKLQTEQFVADGAHVVDSSRPMDEVIDDILRISHVA